MRAWALEATLVALIDAHEDRDRGVSAPTIASVAGVAPAQAQRALTKLVGDGYMEKRMGRYRLTAKAEAILEENRRKLNEQEGSDA